MLLYSEPLQKRYEAPLASPASCIVLALVTGLIVVPFIVAYALGGFWLKENMFFEQPAVTFEKDIVMILTGAGNTLLTWSTRPEFNKYRLNTVRMPTVKTMEVDNDYDGKMDWLDFEVQVPLLETESVNNVQLAFFLDYQVSAWFPLTMKSLAIVNVQYPLPASSLYVDGQLRFRQNRPFASWKPRVVYNESPVNWTLAETDADVTSWQSLVSNYVSRNEITVFDVEYPVWKGSRAATQDFIVSGRIRIDQDQYQYIPHVGEVLKWAWVQYFAFLALTAMFIYPLIGTLVKSQFLTSFMRCDRVPAVNGINYMSLNSGGKSASADSNVNNTTFKQYNF